MKLKLDDAGHVVVSEGKPVYVAEDGKEVAFDVAGTVGAITRLNGEAKSHRERAEKAEASLKAFEGIADPAAAINALNTVKNLDDKKLVDAGEVEKIRSEAINAVEEKYKPVVAENERLKGALHGEKIGGSFARSKFIADKIAVPADIVEARFGKNFKLEDGQVVAYDPSGNKLFSKANPGNPASFDEALEMLVDAYPFKDHILKGSGSSGSGAKPNNGSTGGKVKTNAEFNALPAKDRSVFMADGGKLID